ncbi:cold shock domain-containing protein [Candidatus Bodocaedibacter vickermanii]|uniref:Major cold shock protein CspA n=1 Tax=Candidatus Bodocaedibacter vickermanii TaxID=2741701 RepID=A0A7L9RTU7_9PROT|nr:Major cold shock protein CspA [Candidatus Paracaedibacteraceae bacterium 'Lake Konstanz']
MKDILTKENEKGMWCTVKWYNPYKGYGFVTKDPEGQSPDIFLHFSVLESIDLLQVRQGDQVLCEVAPTQDGVQVTEVFKLKSANPFLAENDRLKRGKKITPPRFMMHDDHAQLSEVEAEIKWFSKIKGFGFAKVKGLKQDVFIHGALLEEMHIQSLKPGQKVRLWITASNNGPEARKIQIK